jgi:hypothetical protein
LQKSGMSSWMYRFRHPFLAALFHLTLLTEQFPEKIKSMLYY